jgi:hypothetical protein
LRRYDHVTKAILRWQTVAPLQAVNERHRDANLQASV